MFPRNFAFSEEDKAFSLRDTFKIRCVTEVKMCCVSTHGRVAKRSLKENLEEKSPPKFECFPTKLLNKA